MSNLFSSRMSLGHIVEIGSGYPPSPQPLGTTFLKCLFGGRNNEKKQNIQSLFFNKKLSPYCWFHVHSFDSHAHTYVDIVLHSTQHQRFVLKSYIIYC